MELAPGWPIFKILKYSNSVLIVPIDQVIEVNFVEIQNLEEVWIVVVAK